MRALVTGASGFLGRVLAGKLLARGLAVRALVRGAGEVPAGCEVVRGDVTDAATLPEAVEGCDLVFHLAGIRRAPGREEFRHVNAEGTRLLLEACLAAGAARTRFVLAGSLAASGPSRLGRREEDTPAPVEWYGESKAVAERLVLAYRHMLPVAVARPPRIMGPGDRENLIFFRLAARGLVLRVLGPERPLSWIDVGDCAEGFLALADRPEAEGGVFFLASDDRTSLEGLQWTIARALGVRPRALPVPPALLRAAGAAADGLSRIVGRRLPLNRKLVTQLLAPGWTCETAKARRLLRFEARTPLSESVERAAAWYRERGLL
ncbi:MAG TPA: NAD-dependent epimerase/dehydratase family protein [Anaeromyxobacteraceae bacterium]